MYVIVSRAFRASCKNRGVSALFRLLPIRFSHHLRPDVIFPYQEYYCEGAVDHGAQTIELFILLMKHVMKLPA